ncbi:MAG: aryl-sulfate sulfotransferase [Bacteroidetes bacterium]|nr:aryl-sulfate sulfotransferase [Bacteroidota bacterium]
MNKLFTKTILLLSICITSILQAQQWNGLTLYSVQNSTTAQLVDTANTTVKTWTGLTTGTGYSSYLMPGGILVRSVKVNNTTFNGGGACGGIQKHDYAGNLLWNFTYSSSTYYSHHDHCPLPNGNVLMIAYESKTQTELTAAGGTVTLASIWPEKIIEVQPTGATTGNIVWEWHVWDHLVQNVNSSKANYQTSIVNHPELLNINYATQKDWMHMNGIDYNPILDQIVVSSHNLCEWYVIDHSTTTAQAASHSGGNSGKGGDFLYRWGNPQVYQATGTKILNVTHDAHWIPEGHPNAGRLVGFNNQGVSTSQSSIDQVMPPYDGNYNYTITPGSAYAPSTYLQRNSGFGYSSNEGSSEQYPNGNQLVCVAIAGKIYELNPAGTPIFTITPGGTSSQAHRYSTCYINNAAPAQPTITTSGSDLTTASATTYQWYYNGVLINGATSQNYTPTQSGIYVVRTTDANGCVYAYSQGYAYSIATAIEELEGKHISIYPNPSSGIIDIDLNYTNPDKLMVRVYDAFGKEVFQVENTSRVDLTQLANGVYTMSIALDNKKPFYKKVVLTN